MKVFFNPELKKQVVYLPYSAIGTEEYFQKLRERILKLKSGGYVVYHTAKAMPSEELTQKEKDIYLRKYRKVGGMLPQRQEVLGKQYFQINSPNSKYTKLLGSASIGFDPKTDVSIIFTINELVDLRESDKGEITLTECDFSIPLDDPYDDTVCTEIGSWDIKTGYQLDAMREAIEHSKHDKIALLVDPSVSRFLRIYLKYIHGYEKMKRVDPKVEGGALKNILSEI